MSYACHICRKNFTIQSNLKRHTKNMHGENRTIQPTSLASGLTIMQHPFTCIVAGCTQSGKTVWVKKLLENAQTTISPPPDRIIWCYGQWQPMYLDMIRTIPGIDLNEGIPENIDNEDFLDVSQRNLIVLDDLMAQSGGDKRIANLFTRGSHHRNLSVIYIVQNIFHQGKQSRNISLNAHYIVLFKSPRDKQQISVLARQVNPGHVQEFMKSYEEATSRPHGYLMLDLKPTTDDQHRLKTNVLPEENTSDQQGLGRYIQKRSYEPSITDDQYQVNSSVMPEENTFDQRNLNRYIRKQSYEQPPILNAMFNSEQKMKQIVEAPLLTPDEKNILYSNELHRFQVFQNQLQNQPHFQNNLQNQLQSFLTTAIKSLVAASAHEPLDQPMQNIVATSNQQNPAYLPGVPAIPKAYFLTPPPTVEHPKRHWHTGDTESESHESEDADDTNADESEREDADDTDADESDIDEPERENSDDADVAERDSGEKVPDEDEDSYFNLKLTHRNDPHNPTIVRIHKNRYHMRSRPY